MHMGGTHTKNTFKISYTLKRGRPLIYTQGGAHTKNTLKISYTLKRGRPLFDAQGGAHKKIINCYPLAAPWLLPGPEHACSSGGGAPVVGVPLCSSGGGASVVAAPYIHYQSVEKP